MSSSNIRDLLTSFSPSLDYFALSLGDGRVKIWDTLKGQVQTEFADISTESTSLFNKPDGGHLSVDYTCMKWWSLDKKKKRKLGSSLLILGTGSGDVLALDVYAGQLKWRVNDCHPRGVSAISFSTHGSCIYSAGADGMVCQMDPLTGNLMGKFKASTKAISCMSVSSDEKILATAATQLKTFNCSNHKKIQKFSGHPGAVRCMIFTEDGRYILSSAVGERYIAMWRVDGGKKQSASCVLAMEHPAVCLDSSCTDDGGLYVLAISETGVCYFWYGKNIDELHNSNPTKVSMSSEDILSRKYKGALPTIFAAKLQGVTKPASGNLFVASGLPVKPSFQKIKVQSGIDMKLDISQDGALLPLSQYLDKSKKAIDKQNRVTTLDRANAEDALLPIPKIVDLQNGTHHSSSVDSDDVAEVDSGKVCMEERLRSVGILGSKDDDMSSSALKSTMAKSIDLEATLPQKKIKAAVLSMEPSDAYKLLEALVAMWRLRSCAGKFVFPWINSILVNHSNYVMSQEPITQTLNSLSKMTKSRGLAVQPLLRLSGCLQLVMAQIDKASQNKTQISVLDHEVDASEDEDDEVDDVLYMEEDDGSQISSDNE